MGCFRLSGARFLATMLIRVVFPEPDGLLIQMALIRTGNTTADCLIFSNMVIEFRGQHL